MREIVLDTETTGLDPLAGHRVVEVGYDSGFESESVFHRQFLALTRMTPGAYRAMNGASVFLVQLPSAYRAQEILAYHARDPESPCERVDGNRIFKFFDGVGRSTVIVRNHREGQQLTIARRHES